MKWGGGVLTRTKYAALALILLLPIVLDAGPVKAVDGCSATLTTNNVLAPNSFNTVQIEVDNFGSSTYRWIRISVPSSNYSLQHSNLNRWTASTTSSQATFTGGVTAPNRSATIFLGVNAGNASPAANWGVQVSDDPSGAGASACSGSLSMSIFAPDVTPPVISGITVSNIQTKSAVVNWTTDEPSNSQVDYGISDQYGQTAYDATLVLNHSLKLTGLLPSKGYHYRVISGDARANYSVSGDNTFITKALPTVPKLVTHANVSTSPSPKQHQNDVNAPIVKLTSDYVNQVLKTAPRYIGSASDDTSVSTIEYSTDGGQNWLPVEKISGLGSQNATFSFTPQIQQEGNYTVAVRAVDGAGNTGFSDFQRLVIDRLPPMVGGFVTTLGPEVLAPDETGNLKTVTGVDQTITLSAVGGPTGINITAQNIKNKVKATNFSLTQSIDSGLWKGIISFSSPGIYQLTANSQDGAGNHTSRTLGEVTVSPTGKVIQQDGQPVKNAQIKVYYLQPDSNNWVLWDGAAYGQNNPLKTDKTGNFSLFLPAGRYYLETKASGYRTLKSQIFQLNQTGSVVPTLTLKKGHNWLNFSSEKININPYSDAPSTANLIGQKLAKFTLESTNGHLSEPLGQGRPTLLSFGSTWMPSASQQAAVLDGLQKTHPQFNIVAVGLGENTAKLLSYNSIAGLNTKWLADPDDTLVNLFKVQSLPQNYFIDRHGVIRKVVSGPISGPEIIAELSKL